MTMIASVSTIADVGTAVVTIVATLVLGIWAYSRFVAQQIVRPPIEFSVKGTPIGEIGGQRIVRITFRVRNGGPRECDVCVWWQLLGLKSTDQISDLPQLPGQLKFARVRSDPAPRSSDELTMQAATSTRDGARRTTVDCRRPPDGKAWLPLTPFQTFVGTGVTQTYEFVTYVDPRYDFATIRGVIEYSRTRSGLARVTTPLARFLSGLSERETKPLTRNHHCGRVIPLAPNAQMANPGTEGNEIPSAGSGRS